MRTGPPYPAEGRHTIDIELRGSDHQDHEDEYWTVQLENLQRQFERKLRTRIESRDVRHLSVFALAPQPVGQHCRTDLFVRDRRFVATYVRTVSQDMRGSVLANSVTIAMRVSCAAFIASSRFSG